MDFLLPPSGAGGGKLSKKKGKSSGLDGAFLRKERELKYFRIQKDRRVLQTNRMRKEVDSHHGKSQSNSNNDNNEEDEGEDSDHDMIEQDEKKENSFIKSENTRNTPPYYSQV